MIKYRYYISITAVGTMEVSFVVPEPKIRPHLNAFFSSAFLCRSRQPLPLPP